MPVRLVLLPGPFVRAGRRRGTTAKSRLRSRDERGKVLAEGRDGISKHRGFEKGFSKRQGHAAGRQLLIRPAKKETGSFPAKRHKIAVMARLESADFNSGINSRRRSIRCRRPSASGRD